MKKVLTAAVIGMWSVCATAGSAIVIDTVPVGHPGNAGELSGGGPARICGAVNYEYRIGKYEVTAGQYTEFLNKVAGVDTYGLYNGYMSNTSYGSGITQTDANGDGLWEYSVASAFANRPVNLVNWGDSARFANWLHNGQPTGAQGLSTTEDGSYTLNGATTGTALLAVTRKPNATWVIPSEDEWYKAAYYKGGGTNAGYFDYPTSSDTAPGRDMADVSGNNANYWYSYYWASGSYPIDSGKYTTVVGQFQNSASPYGTFDQGGNVWEWNEAVISGLSRGLRGGWFGEYDDAYLYGVHGGMDAPFRTDYLGFPTHDSTGIGFRVSEVPEPASIAVLALGGIGMLVRRRGVRG